MERCDRFKSLHFSPSTPVSYIQVSKGPLHFVPPGHLYRLPLLCPSYACCHLRPLSWQRDFSNSTNHIFSPGSKQWGQEWLIFFLSAKCFMFSRDLGAQYMNEAVYHNLVIAWM